DVRQRGQPGVVHAVGDVVREAARGAADAGVEALVADRHQVVVVDALDERGHLVGPAGQRVGGAGAGGGQGGVDAARLVGQLPGEDGGLVLVLHTGDRVGPVEQRGE